VIAGTVNLSGTLTGVLQANSIVVNAGATVSPGDSPGTITTGAAKFNGGTYVWELKNATGQPGVGFDQVKSTGVVDLSGATSITVQVRGLLNQPGSVPGRPANFDESQSYSFRLIEADAGVTGFNPSVFTIDRTGIDPYIAASQVSFSVTSQADGVYLQVAPVPEPSAVLVIVFGACAVVAGYRRIR
jgi:hypothetical protein